MISGLRRTSNGGVNPTQCPAEPASALVGTGPVAVVRGLLRLLDRALLFDGLVGFLAGGLSRRFVRHGAGSFVGTRRSMAGERSRRHLACRLDRSPLARRRRADDASSPPALGVSSALAAAASASCAASGAVSGATTRSVRVR